MSHSSVFPSIDPKFLTDFLTKLGEKAFFAWLQFQNWILDKNPLNGSHVIPLSLNQVIKRLKTAKTTFYYRILRPLLQYGLVGLQSVSHHKQEKNLVIHSVPFLPTQQHEAVINSTILITEQPASEFTSPIDTRQQDLQLEDDPLQQDLIWTDLEDSITFEPIEQPADRNEKKYGRYEEFLKKENKTNQEERDSYDWGYLLEQWRDHERNQPTTLKIYALLWIAYPTLNILNYLISLNLFDFISL